MGHYRANLRDIEFTLFDVLRAGDVLGTATYPELDADTARTVLAEVAQLAEGPLAEPFADGDRHPATLDPATHEVRLPESFRRAYQTWIDAEWWRLEVPPELGGQRCPPTIRWAMAELVLGANPPLYFYASGPRFAAQLWRDGDARQRRLAQLMIDGRWAATMALTEPDAGSDVGAGRTTATPQPDGSWHLSGVKRFITSGDHDLAENIVHFVLARPVGVPGVGGPGTKGLSLFIVPKYLVDLDTGKLGARNGVVATNLEHKMGINASATCELTFGADGPAVGYLLGGVHDGIAQMFKIIEYARMLVGTKAIATLSTGYLNALDYAKQRVQGPDLTQQHDRTAARVTITHHPDVRRSLLTQKAYAEGLRALVLYTAAIQDAIEVGAAQGTDTADLFALNDLLLPVLKGYGSERAWVTLGTESLQTFGGSGFLADYPLEQYVRDAKIDTLYEGTTAIQGLDLFFRKIVRDKGRALSGLAAQIGRFAAAGGPADPLKAERATLGRALDDVQGIVQAMLGFLRAADPRAGGEPRAVYLVAENTSRLLMAIGDVLLAWLLLRKAEVAHGRLAAGGGEAADVDFYRGVVGAARWFCRQTLPRLAAERTIVEATTGDLMELPEAAF